MIADEDALLAVYAERVGCQLEDPEVWLADAQVLGDKDAVEKAFEPSRLDFRPLRTAGAVRHQPETMADGHQRVQELFYTLE
jgi:hypothetical protein